MLSLRNHIIALGAGQLHRQGRLCLFIRFIEILLQFLVGLSGRCRARRRRYRPLLRRAQIALEGGRRCAQKIGHGQLGGDFDQKLQAFPNKTTEVIMASCTTFTLQTPILRMTDCY